jgi:hypothetical protein
MDRGFVKTRTASTNYLYNLTLTYRRFLGFPALGKNQIASRSDQSAFCHTLGQAVKSIHFFGRSGYARIAAITLWSQECQIETFEHVKARGISTAVRADCAALAIHQVSASSMSAFCPPGAPGKTDSSLRRTSAVAAKCEFRRSAALSASPLRTALRMA